MSSQTVDETSTSLRADVILARAAEIAPKFRERATAAEAARRLPDETIEDARAAGFFKILIPQELGGAGGDLRDVVQLVRTIASADLSSAWALSFLTTHAWLMTRLSPQAQSELFVDGEPPLVSMSARPPGRATPIAGGYELSGRWGYCSAVLHADWMALVGLVEGADDAAAPTVQGLDHRASLFVVPKSEVEVLDTWNTTGMQATGSNDVVVDKVFVPAHRRIEIDRWHVRDNPGSALYADALYSYDTRDVLSFLKPAMAVGAAAGMLADFSRRMESRKAAFTADKLIDTVPGQMRYAKALTALRAAEATLESALRVVEEGNASTREPLTHEQRVLLKLDNMTTYRMAWECIELILGGSGSSVLVAADPTQRAVRDMLMLLSHMTIDEDRMYSKSGEILLGRATDADPTQNFT